jgi:UDP-N-acetylglucosamine acyltransferase
MSDAIHPSAVIDPRARLGAGVRVGAFCVIGGDVTLEDGVEVGHHVVLEGRVALAPRVKVGHGSVVGGVPQDLKYKDGTLSGVRVGAGTVIREYVTIHRSTHAEGWTEIGRECLVMALSHVAHDCRLGDGVIVINYAGITGHCEIGDRATVGGFSGMVPFTRIGAHAYVGGMAKVTADVPPYVLVDGQPATARAINVVGLRRAGMVPAERRVLQDAFRILYRSGLAPARAVERMREELPASEPVRLMLEFIAAASRHGIVKGAGMSVEDGGDEASPPSPPGSRGALHGSGQPNEVSD